MLNNIEIENVDVDVKLTLDYICDEIEKQLTLSDDNQFEKENDAEKVSAVCEVPKKGIFYEHDDRIAGAAKDEEDGRKVEIKKPIIKKGSIEGKWEHDLFESLSTKKNYKQQNNNRNYAQKQESSTRNISNEEKHANRSQHKNHGQNNLGKFEPRKSTNEAQNKHPHYESKVNYPNRSNYDRYNERSHHSERQNNVEFPRTKSCHQIRHNSEHNNHETNHSVETSHNTEAPKKSYFLQRRKQHEKKDNRADSSDTQVKSQSSSHQHGNYSSHRHTHNRAENQNYQNSQQHKHLKAKEQVYDEPIDFNNNNISLPKSLSFSNSKYKQIGEMNNSFDDSMSLEFQKMRVQKQKNISEDFFDPNQVTQTSRPIVGQQRHEEHYLTNIQQQQQTYFPTHQTPTYAQIQNTSASSQQQQQSRQQHFIALPPGIDLAHIVMSQQQQFQQQAFLPQVDYQLSMQNQLYYQKN